MGSRPHFPCSTDGTLRQQHRVLHLLRHRVEPSQLTTTSATGCRASRSPSFARLRSPSLGGYFRDPGQLLAMVLASLKPVPCRGLAFVSRRAKRCLESRPRYQRHLVGEDQAGQRRDERPDDLLRARTGRHALDES
jgi:hypothetical protein